MIARYRPQSQRAADLASKPAPKLATKPAANTTNRAPSKDAAMLFQMKAEQLVVPDDIWPQMFRVKLKDGSLSGLYQLGQARDLAKTLLRNSRAGTG